MSYQVTIIHNPTGYRVVADMNFDWHQASHFWWTDGNFGCDCNRRSVFLEALGVVDTSDDDEDRCGDEEFGVILPNGAKHRVKEDTASAQGET